MRPSHSGVPQTFVKLDLSHILTVNVREQSARFQQGGGENTWEYSVLNKLTLRKNYLTKAPNLLGFYQSLTDLGKGNIQIQPTLAFHLGKEILSSSPLRSHLVHRGGRKKLRRAL